MRVNLLILLTLPLSLIPVAASAHGIGHAVQRDDAVIVVMTHDDGSPLVGARYEVRGPGDDAAVATGRTDGSGRLAFLPDRPGAWAVKVDTDDGHGARIAVEVDADGLPLETDGSRGRFGRIVVGLLLIVALTLLLRRTQRRDG